MSLCIVTCQAKPLVMEGLNCPGMTEQTALLLGRLLKILKAYNYSWLSRENLVLTLRAKMVSWAASIMAGNKPGMVVSSVVQHSQCSEALEGGSQV